MTKWYREPFSMDRIIGALAASALLLGAPLATAAQANYQGKRLAVTPQRGGSYSIWLGGAPDCLDPQKTAAASSDTVAGYVFDPLLSIDTKGHYVGDLATKYKVSNHGLRITFTLRRGVRFSNGDPFTSSAVKYTFNRALNPATKSPATAALLAQVANVSDPSKYVVVLN
ncbi:MAG: ABC transporter substrate-binding protein, partial [Chloroflexota bacterium]